MPSDEQYQLLLFVHKCKNLQIDATAYRDLLESVLAQTNLMDFQLQSELDKARISLQPAIEAEYLELEQAILDGGDVLSALKRLVIPRS